MLLYKEIFGIKFVMLLKWTKQKTKQNKKVHATKRIHNKANQKFEQFFFLIQTNPPGLWEFWLRLIVSTFNQFTSWRGYRMKKCRQIEDIKSGLVCVFMAYQLLWGF